MKIIDYGSVHNGSEIDGKKIIATVFNSDKEKTINEAKSAYPNNIGYLCKVLNEKRYLYYMRIV
jgi:hypothetical protein